MSTDWTRPPGECVYCHVECGLRYVCEACDAKFEAEQRRRAAERRAKRLVACGLPEEYATERKTLFSYRPATPKQATARQAAHDWSERKLATPWLFLHGTVGTGKTHLAAAALVRRVERASDAELGLGLFVVFDDLVRALQGTFRANDGPSEHTLLQKYCECDYLVLDDIGVREPTSYASGILFALINARYSTRRPTIMTSNRSLARIGAGLAPAGEELQADRILDRIVELAIGLEVDGPSGRRVG